MDGPVSACFGLGKPASAYIGATLVWASLCVGAGLMVRGCVLGRLACCSGAQNKALGFCWLRRPTGGEGSRAGSGGRALPHRSYELQTVPVQINQGKQPIAVPSPKLVAGGFCLQPSLSSIPQWPRWPPMLRNAGVSHHSTSDDSSRYGPSKAIMAPKWLWPLRTYGP